MIVYRHNVWLLIEASRFWADLQNSLFLLRRQPVASGIPLRYSRYFVCSARGSSRVVRSGVPLRGIGAPLPFCSYITVDLVVVDRARGACPVTCSYRHLTSYLFRAFDLSPLSRLSRIWPLTLVTLVPRISTTHSIRPQACAVSFLSCYLSVSQATSLGFWRQEKVILVAIRAG